MTHSGSSIQEEAAEVFHYHDRSKSEKVPASCLASMLRCLGYMPDKATERLERDNSSAYITLDEFKHIVGECHRGTECSGSGILAAFRAFDSGQTGKIPTAAIERIAARSAETDVGTQDIANEDLRFLFKKELGGGGFVDYRALAADVLARNPL